MEKSIGVSRLYGCGNGKPFYKHDSEHRVASDDTCATVDPPILNPLTSGESKMRITMNRQEIELSELTKQKLLEIKQELETENDTIRDRLKRAEAHLKQTGEYAKPEWYWSAVRAYKHRVRLVQAIQTELSNRKGRATITVADYFVDLARARLDVKVFQELLTEAKETANWAEGQR